MQLERESPRVSQRRVDQISYLIKGHQAILNILLVWFTLFIIDPHELSCNHWWQLERVVI